MSHGPGRWASTGRIEVEGSGGLAIIDWWQGKHPIRGTIAVAGDHLLTLTAALVAAMTPGERDRLIELLGGAR